MKKGIIVFLLFITVLSFGKQPRIDVKGILNDQISIKINGIFSAMVLSEEKKVTASVTALEGNVIYTWYLNNNEIATGSIVTIKNISKGHHYLMVKSVSSDGKRSGSAGFEFNAVQLLTARAVSGSAIQVFQQNQEITNHGKFDFDIYPTTNRFEPKTFLIYNSGTVPVFISGNPMLDITGNNPEAFTADTSLTTIRLMPKTSTTCSIQLTSSEYRGFLKTAHVSILNSTSTMNPFEFDLSCTDKLLSAKIVTSNNKEIINQGKFNFDTIPAASRDMKVTFTLFNTGTVDYILSGNPVVQLSEESAASFTLNASSVKTTLFPNTSTAFTVQLTSTEYQGLEKNAHLLIKNPIRNFDFDISCTDKLLTTNLYPASGTYQWTCPVIGYITVTNLVGGSGGGGSGAQGYYRAASGNPPYTPAVPELRVAGSGGGGGGGSANVTGTYSIAKNVYTVKVGSAGLGNSSGAGSSGGDSGIYLNSAEVCVSPGGKGGSGGVTSSSFTPVAGGAGNPAGSSSKNDSGDPDGGNGGGSSSCIGTGGDGDSNGTGQAGTNATCRGAGGGGGGGGGSVLENTIIGYDPYGHPIYKNVWKVKLGGKGGNGYDGIVTFTALGFTKN